MSDFPTTAELRKMTKEQLAATIQRLDTEAYTWQRKGAKAALNRADKVYAERFNASVVLKLNPYQ